MIMEVLLFVCFVVPVALLAVDLWTSPKHRSKSA
jgi:hypothetical protein